MVSILTAIVTWHSRTFFATDEAFKMFVIAPHIGQATIAPLSKRPQDYSAKRRGQDALKTINLALAEVLATLSR